MKKSKWEIKRTVEVSVLGKITATAGTLNSLSILLMEIADKNRKDGQNAIADLRDEQSYQIYDALRKTGFYDD